MVSKQRSIAGQAMVEYTVIMSFFVILLLQAGDVENEGYASVFQLEEAIQNKQRGYSYALSLSAIPETDNLTELADYYDSLGKYPKLSEQIAQGDQAMKGLVDGYTSIMDPIKDAGSPSAIIDDAKNCLRSIGQSTINLLRGSGFC